MNVRILVAAVLLLAACTPAWTAEDSDTWKTLFSDGLLDAEGKTVSPDQLKGKLVGIYFSAHWCPPCRAFTPRLVAFRDKNAAEFEVVLRLKRFGEGRAGLFQDLGDLVGRLQGSPPAIGAAEPGFLELIEAFGGARLIGGQQVHQPPGQ